MPAEIEFETKEHQEQIQEHLHDIHPSHWARFIPVVTAILAVVGAYAALEAGALVNHALLEQGSSNRKQSEISDQWAYYQAKGVKSNIAQATADLLAASPANGEAASRYRTEAQRYREEQKAIEEKAHELEKERDETNRESEHLMHRHHTFAYAVTFAQVAIALSAIAALTRRRRAWVLSLIAGVLSVAFVIMGWLTR